jgi:hypothetical protein
MTTSGNQKYPFVFVDASERVNADIYKELPMQHVAPWVRRTYQDGNDVFQQDSMLAHTTRTTQVFLNIWWNSGHWWIGHHICWT